MNSTHPFYLILIPNTPYGNFSLFFFLVVGGPKNPKIFFMISKNILFLFPIVNKTYFLSEFVSGYSKTKKKVPFSTKLQELQGGAIVAGPLKNNFFLGFPKKYIYM